MGRILNPEFILALCCVLIGMGCIFTAFITGPWIGINWLVLWIGMAAIFTGGMLQKAV